MSGGQPRGYMVNPDRLGYRVRPCLEKNRYQYSLWHRPLRLTSQLLTPHGEPLVTFPGMQDVAPVPLSQIHTVDLAGAGFPGRHAEARSCPTRVGVSACG